MSLFNACNARDKARRARAAAQMPFQVCRLTQAGAPSKMHDAVSAFTSSEEALAYISRVRNLNAGKSLRYSINGQEI